MAALSWLTKEFLEDILKKSEKDSTISVTKFDTKAATRVGENYSSEVHRIQVDITRGDKSDKISLIMKTMVTQVPEFVKMIEESGLFLNEINMMTNTLKKMNERLKADERLSPRPIFACLKTPVLIMEDLTPLGFRMVDSLKRLDLAHSLLAIKNLGKFHASSVAVCEQEPKHRTMYTKNIYLQKRPETSEMFSLGLKQVGKNMVDWPELDPKYGEKVINFAPHFYRKLGEALEPIESDFNAIIHGDYWINNMLFRYDQRGEPIEHILIDFQICVWSSPAADLQYFMNTSLMEDVYINHRDRLLEEYRRSLLITMKRLECKTQVPTLLQLQNAMKRHEVFGILATFILLPMLMFDKSNVAHVNELWADENNLPLQNKLYREILVRRVSEFEKSGVFDV